jgi:hypothetical protein
MVQEGSGMRNEQEEPGTGDIEGDVKGGDD